MAKNDIGFRIRDIRESRRIYQNTLAKMVGVSRGHINAIEHGRYTPNLTTAIKIADALGITLDELVGRTNNERDTF